MFTGIIEEVGTLRHVARDARGVTVEVEARVVTGDLKVGDSVATNGVCLTVTAFHATAFRAEVMPETARRSTFDAARVGDAVNLERALPLGGRLGGHLVSGHVDGTGRVTGRVQEGIATWLTVAAGEEVLRYVVEKGSIAVDGVSLTVAAVGRDWFRVSLVPHTRGATTLEGKRVGDAVNLECDVMAKYAEKLLRPGDEREGMTMDFLREHGF